MGGLICYLLTPEYPALVIFAASFAVFFSLYVTNVVLGVIDSAIVTLFVCFAERPHEMLLHNEMLYHKIHTGYSEKCPNLFVETP